MNFNKKLLLCFTLISITQATLPAQERRTSITSTDVAMATETSSATAQETSLKQLYEQAQKYLSEDNQKLACETYERILSLNPNHTQTLYDLGSCYFFNGQHAEAVRLWISAANQGHKEAQFNLGTCYINNQGVSSNLIPEQRLFHGFLLLVLAANQGLPEAQYSLGMCYFNNQGVPSSLTQAQRYAEAARLLAFAANQKHSEAAWILAQCFINGTGGVSRDYDKALTLYEQVLQKGDNVKLSLFYKMYKKHFLPQCSGFENLAHRCFAALVDQVNPEIHEKLAREKRAKDQIEATKIESYEIGDIDYAAEPCPICQVNFEANQKIMLFNNNSKSCFHVLCQNCLTQLRNSHLIFRCPLCREIPTTVSPITVMPPATQARQQQNVGHSSNRSNRIKRSKSSLI